MYLLCHAMRAKLAGVHAASTDQCCDALLTFRPQLRDKFVGISNNGGSFGGASSGYDRGMGSDVGGYGGGGSNSYDR